MHKTIDLSHGIYLEIHVVGQCRLLTNRGDTIIIDRLASQKLLVYLILNRDSFRSRDTISGNLWPELHPTAQRVRLRKNLYYLNHALKRANPTQSYILKRNNHLAWSSEDTVWIDLPYFRDFLTTLQTRKIQRLSNTELQTIHQILDLTQSNTISFSEFDDWKLYFQLTCMHFVSLHERMLSESILEDTPHTTRVRELISDSTLDIAKYIDSLRVVNHSLYSDLVNISRISSDTHRPLPNTQSPRSLQYSDEFPTFLDHRYSLEYTSVKIALLTHSKQYISIIGESGTGKTRILSSIALWLQQDRAISVAYYMIEYIYPKDIPAQIDELKEKIIQDVSTARAGLLDQKQTILIFLDNCGLIDRLIPEICHTVNAIHKEARFIFSFTRNTSFVPTMPSHLIFIPPKGDESRTNPIREIQHNVASSHLLERISPIEEDILQSYAPILTLQDTVAWHDGIPETSSFISRNSSSRHSSTMSLLSWHYRRLSQVQQVCMRIASFFSGGITAVSLSYVYCTLHPSAPLPTDTAYNILHELEQNSFCYLSGMKIDESLKNRFVARPSIAKFSQGISARRGEITQLELSHLDYFINLCNSVRKESASESNLNWLSTLEEERVNLHQAMKFTIDSGDRKSALTLGGKLYPFWYLKGYTRAESTWLGRALALPGECDKCIEALATLGQSVLLIANSKLERSYLTVEESIRIARNCHKPAILIKALDTAIVVSRIQERLTRAEQFCIESIALQEKFGKKDDVSQTMVLLADIRISKGSILSAREILERIVEENQDSAFLGSEWDTTMLTLAQVQILMGQFADAKSILVDSIARAAIEEIPETLSNFQDCLARVEHQTGNFRRSEALFRDATISTRKSTNAVQSAITTSNSGELFLHYLDHDKAKLLLESSAKVYERLHSDGNLVQCSLKLIELYLYEEEFRNANQLLGKCMGLAMTSERLLLKGWILRAMGQISTIRNLITFANSCTLRSMRIFRLAHARPDICRCLEQACTPISRCSDFDLVAELIGTADAMREEMGYVRSPLDSHYLEEPKAKARRALGNEAFESARLRGYKRPEDATVTMALAFLRASGAEEAPVDEDGSIRWFENLELPKELSKTGNGLAPENRVERND